MKIHLSEAEMHHLWWVGSWPVSMKIDSRNTAGASTVTETHGLEEPARFDPVKVAKATITASKKGKYTVTISGDPSLFGAISVKLGSSRLSHTSDQQIGKNGKLVRTFTLTSAALKHLEKVKSEKVSIAAVAFGKGNPNIFKPVSDTEKVTLKAPKAKK